MDRRLEDGKVPAQVRKLMRKEAARGFNQPQHTMSAEEKVSLRESYCKMLEDQLDALGLRNHWGKTLKWKMKKFKAEALETLECWASLHNINLADFEENEDGYIVTETENGEYMALAVERSYDHSLYGLFERVLNSL